MRLFLIPAGIVLGLIFGATVVAAPAWVSRLAIKRSFGAGFRAATAFSLAQGGWALVAASILFTMGRAYWRMDPGLRGIAILLLLILAYQIWRAKPLGHMEVENCPENVFRFTLKRSFSMPLRLPAYLALIVAVNLPLRIHGLNNALPFAIGIALGHWLWLGFFSVVARFGRNVPDPICLKSLNKLRFLSMVVLLGLAAIAAGPYFFSEYIARF